MRPRYVHAMPGIASCVLASIVEGSGCTWIPPAKLYLPADTTALGATSDLTTLAMWPGELRRVTLPVVKGKAGSVYTFELGGDPRAEFSVTNDAALFQSTVREAIRFVPPSERAQQGTSPLEFVGPLPGLWSAAPTFCYVRLDTLATLGDTLRVRYTVSSTTNPPRKSVWRIRIVVVPPPAIALRHTASIETLAVHPNPANESVMLTFSVPSPTTMFLQIFDATGREIARVSDHAIGAGKHTVTWNGKDAIGNAVPSGVYFVRLQTRSASLVQKMVVLK